MHLLANELNTVLEGTVAGRLLSDLGRLLYFPKGIIAQSAEAKKAAVFANGTIGMAYAGGKPLALSAACDNMAAFKPEEVVAYAPTAGVERLRTLWKDEMIKKNPSLDPAGISLPVVVPGLTAGLLYTAELFCGRGDSVIVSDPCWDNYSLIFEIRRDAELLGVPFVSADGPGLNIEAIEAAVRRQAKTKSVRIMFNFPNNPAGYSPSAAEQEALVGIIREAAEGGADVLVISDDAYFGLFYEDNIFPESLFARFAALHDRVLAVKIGGSVKEDFAWGLRIGFLTFGSKGLSQAHYDALMKKTMGAIRSSVSCANTSAQYMALKILEDPRTPGEKERFRAMLRRRYELVKAFIAAHPNHPALRPLPFNSGYFMSFHTRVNAETLRQELLTKHGVGVISLGENCLRVAYSSIDEEKITETYRILYETAEKLC